MPAHDPAIGRRQRRLEDPHLLTGRGRFVDDASPRRSLHAAFVRSTVARARIRSVDVSAARELRGVHAVFTAAEMAEVCGGWKGILDWPGMVSGEQHPLARDEVRHLGEPVVLVLASSRHVAEDAAELVLVDYEPLTPVLDPFAALEPNSDRVHPDLPDNLCFEMHAGEGEVDAAFKNAHRIVDITLSTGRHTAMAIETRGVVASYDPLERSLSVRVSTQAPHMLQSTYAQLLGLPENAVRILTEDVGGAFGMKAFVYPDEMAVVAASTLVDRPVTWVQDRYEALLADTHARDEHIRASLAIDEDGRFLGLKSEVLSDVGAYSVYPRSSVTEGVQVVSIMPGPYRIPSYAGHLRVAFTNKAPLAVYRAVGHPPAILTMELLVDEAARELGLDPAEVRRRNLLLPEDLPFRSVTGNLYDSGSHLEAYERLVKLVGDVEQRRESARLRGRLLGVGTIAFVELSAPGAAFYGAKGAPITAHDQVEVRIEPDGSAMVLLGTPGQGQGLETSAAQVVADHLGLPFDAIRVVSGDTYTVPHGTGVWGSRSAVVSGGAAANAAQQLRERVQRIAAHMFEADPEDVEVVEGVARVRGSGVELSFAEVARAAHWDTLDFPEDLDLGLAVVGEYRGPNATFNNGAHAAIVEIDPGTGFVDLVEYLVVEDCGVLINPEIVDGQIRGGVTQGVGGALFEHLVYDDNGQLLTSTLLDYLVPSATDLPDIAIEHIETPSPVTVLGTKGVGEAGTAGAPAAVHCAVNDALARRGGRVWHQPITPEQVLDAIPDPRASASGTT